MSNITQKATIATVLFGLMAIEGLMAEDATFGIAVPQLVSHNLVPPNRSLKQINTLYSTGFQSHQWRTTLNPKAVNVILITDFEKLLFELALAGNKHAQELSRTLIGLSLQQIFSDAFDVKFEKEERQDYLKNRQVHKKCFHPLYSSWLKADGITTTYGTKVNELKTQAKLPLVSIDTYDASQLQKLNNAEVVYDAMRRSGRNHFGALELV